MLIHRTPEEKTLIREAYTMVHGRDLIQDIRANCKGEYEKALVALVAPTARTYARGIKLTAKGWLSSTNKSGLIALLTATRNTKTDPKNHRSLGQPIVLDECRLEGRS